MALAGLLRASGPLVVSRSRRRCLARPPRPLPPSPLPSLSGRWLIPVSAPDGRSYVSVIVKLDLSIHVRVRERCVALSVFVLYLLRWNLFSASSISFRTRSLHVETLSCRRSTLTFPSAMQKNGCRRAKSESGPAISSSNLELSNAGGEAMIRQEVNRIF